MLRSWIPRPCTLQTCPFSRPLTRPFSATAPACAAAAAVVAKEQPRARQRRPLHRDDPKTGMRSYVPRTPGIRHLRRPINDHLWKGRAHLPLTTPRKGHHLGGRNRNGQITVRHRGGGHKRRIRIVDFARVQGGRQLVERIEYDPGRSAHIALLNHQDTGEKSYILAAEGLRAGDIVESFISGLPPDLLAANKTIEDLTMLAPQTAMPGNCLPLDMIPPGMTVFNVGLKPGCRGQLCRSAGTYATVISRPNTMEPKYRGFVTVKLKSGEVRRIPKMACATIGVASNRLHGSAQLGKAGRKRWLGFRPTVRGVAMNACDHPHGGGRGKSKGNRIPVSIWGSTLAKSGYKTRKRSRPNKAVVTPRPRNHGKRRQK